MMAEGFRLNGQKYFVQAYIFRLQGLLDWVTENWQQVKTARNKFDARKGGPFRRLGASGQISPKIPPRGSPVSPLNPISFTRPKPSTRSASW